MDANSKIEFAHRRTLIPDELYEVIYYYYLINVTSFELIIVVFSILIIIITLCLNFMIYYNCFAVN